MSEAFLAWLDKLDEETILLNQSSNIDLIMLGWEGSLKTLEREVEELQTIAKKYYIAAEEKEGEEYFDGRWRMAGEILNIIRSKKGADK